MAAPRFRLAGRPMFTLREALLLTAASMVLPGVAHLRAGRRRTGTALLLSYAAALAIALIIVSTRRDTLLRMAVQPVWLSVAAVLGVVVASAWAALVIWSYTAVRPAHLPLPLRAAAGGAVAVLCALAALPPLTVARYSRVQHDLVESVFAGPRQGTPHSASGAGPGIGQRRLNVLLIGGDADVHRPGLRTDSMTLASIDTRTGNTVLLSLPRNLQHVPLWTGRGHPPRLPREELLNAVYAYGHRYPGLVGSDVRDPGAELLKRTVGHILGLPVHQYVMVDMRSFRTIVQAMGGVRVCARRPIPVPTEQVRSGVLRPGCRRLTGREALWFGRSRTGSSDYMRMGRQKCLLWALVQQADPMTVLRSFRRLAQTFRRSVSTDVPRDMLPGLVRLSGRVRHAQTISVQFIPPQFRPWRPDYLRIRAMAVRAVSISGQSRIPMHEAHLLGKTCS